MKLILWISILFVTVPALAGSVGGFVAIDRDQYTYIDMQTNRRYTIRPVKSDTVESLKKLKNLDYFQGQGELQGNVLLLDTIDFVGLRRLLGLWTADATSILDFQDYSKVIVYRTFLNVATPRAALQYSIAPASGADWRIFFTDENSVVLASLVLQDARATLKFFDLNSGSVVKTVELTRLPPRH
jgi:hypothetical protein